jgi:HAD superfamily hydrolase (TIGR01509 family)
MQALVIFDCDGVLVDSERLSHGVLHEMLAELGATLSFDETVFRFIGTSIHECLARATQVVGRPLPDDFSAQFARRTKTAFEASLGAVQGIEALLNSMTTRFCVASNGNRAKVNFTLGHTGLLPRFEGRIFTAEDVAQPKPAPDLFLLAARMMGADPNSTTVVEDTPTGIVAAKRAGMKAIGFAAMTPDSQLVHAGADAIVKSMTELATLLVAGRADA